ncbi:MAG TPA: SLATT domain-containing protein [Tepidisphaeraceae bacterium]|jgi:hypothetical protein|nr:SLATT domain-containing protein [Tepidisphaeraceae bacterium]
MNDTPEKPLDAAVLKVLIAEAARIEEDSTYSAKGQYECADAWAYRNLWIGIPTTVVAAGAGVVALKDQPILAGIMSLAVAASSAVFTFLNPREQALNHLAAGNAFKALQNDARIFYTIECVHRPNDAGLVADLKALNERRNKLNAESPQPSRKAFERARKGIEAGEARYAVDAEKSRPA